MDLSAMVTNGQPQGALYQVSIRKVSGGFRFRFSLFSTQPDRKATQGATLEHLAGWFVSAGFPVWYKHPGCGWWVFVRPGPVANLLDLKLAASQLAASDPKPLVEFFGGEGVLSAWQRGHWSWPLDAKNPMARLPFRNRPFQAGGGGRRKGDVPHLSSMRPLLSLDRRLPAKG